MRVLIIPHTGAHTQSAATLPDRVQFNERILYAQLDGGIVTADVARSSYHEPRSSHFTWPNQTSPADEGGNAVHSLSPSVSYQWDPRLR
jgi:hypothetical protein